MGLNLGVDHITAQMRSECTDIVTVVQVAIGAIAVAAVGVQVVLALRVSRYARMLAQREERQHGERVMGKEWEKETAA